MGIDVGGTFTDLVLIEEATGERAVGKVLTPPREIPPRPLRRGLWGCWNVKTFLL